MTDIAPHIESFLTNVGGGAIEIYNEASVQFELAILLRAELEPGHTVHLERHVDALVDGDTTAFEKKEADIIVCDPDGTKHCIEIKFPRNGQHPRQMYNACEDIRFLKRLVMEGGFGTSHFLMIADDPLFWGGGYATAPIYGHFRKGVPITGGVMWGGLPLLEFTGEKYTLQWYELLGTNLRYILLPVS